MKPIYALIAALLLTTLQLSAQNWQWTHPEINPNPNSKNYAHDVEVDSSGNAYVLGVYWDSLYLGGNFIAKGYGSYIAKYNQAGSLLWYKLITSLNASGLLIYASDMVVNAQGVFITGRYAPTSPYDYDCNTGHYSGTYLKYRIGDLKFTSSHNELGFFLTKLNSNGTVVWNKLGTYDVCSGSAGAGAFDTKPNITSDKNGNITASFLLGSNDLSVVSIGGDNIPIRSGYTVGQLVVAKYSTTGILKWSTYAGGFFNTPNGGTGYVQDCNSTAVDNNGNIFFYGTAKDSTFFGSQLFRTSTPPSENQYYYPATFLAKLSSNGVWQFVKELCTESANTFRDGIGEHKGNPDLLTVDGNNNVYALVHAANNSAILRDTIGLTYGGNFLVKITNNGTLVWDKFFGNGTAYGQSLCYRNNSLYINGSLANQNLVFSTLYFRPEGVYYQSFVAKADLNGNYQWVTSAAGNDNVWGADIKVYQDNIYTCGNYGYDITNLGNLNSTYPTAATSIFFGKLKDQYIRVGVITPTALIPGCTISVPFASYGLSFSLNSKFIAELSDAYGDFINATAIGNATSTGSGTITATVPASLTYGSGFRVRIRSSDTLATGYNYYAYADTGYALALTCSAPSSGFSATNVTAASATLNWTAVSCAAGYKVQYRVKGTTAWATKNIGTNIPSLTIAGLTANTIYQWHVATKCVNNGTSSFSAFSAIKQFTTTTALAAKHTTTPAINVEKSLAITVQPNPATTTAFLMMDGVVKNASVSISDLTGKIIWKTDAVNTNRLKLPVQNFAPGIYLIKLVNGGEVKVVKLVKD